tara:strand:- start:853 stop:1035 length:183 start_codon:yes stop_codon:yes gene_type:complete
MFVLLSPQNTYFVEFLLNHLALSSSISEAMVFKEIETAKKFKFMLKEQVNIDFSINTYIE